MPTFTNIAREPYQCTIYSYSPYYELVRTPALYSEWSSCVYGTRKSTEATVTLDNFLTTGLVSGHTYYACYWCRASGEGTRTTDLYIGSNINSEADNIVAGVTVPSGSWARASGIKALSDAGGKRCRIDYNNAQSTGSVGYFCGFLVVDLTNAGLTSKSKAWLDDHLYWVPAGQSGTYTDYDAEGSKAKASDSGNPSVANLKTYHNYAAQKANRSGTTVDDPPKYASASWVNKVSNKTKGSTYGSCGVVKIQPANWGTITTPSGANFNTTGRTTINTLIRNADALYAQQYCIQKTIKYPTCSCDADCSAYGCVCDYDCCDSNCCDHDCSCYGNCYCDGDCDCNWDCSGYCDADDGCGDCVNCWCDNDTTCCNEDCDNCSCNSYGLCSANACSCNSVCSCNWV